MSAALGHRHDQRGLLWLVALGFFMETLDATIVTTALPSMARAFGASDLAMQAVVIAYVLTLAALIPASGWLADRWGTRRIYLAAVGIFTAGSALCACSASLAMLVAARVVQGIGGAMLLPVGRLALLRAFPGGAYMGALAFVTTPALLGPLVGPPLGGYPVEAASWHWIFLINLPIGCIGAVAVWRLMPQARVPTPAPFDGPGFALVVGGMLAICLALDGLGELHWPTSVVGLLAAAGAALWAAYVAYARRCTAPLFSLELFATRSYSIGILGNLFARLGSGSMPLMLPLFFQTSLGMRPGAAGLSMLPTAAASIAVKQVVGPIVARMGYRRFLLINTMALSLCIASFAAIAPATPHWQTAILLVLFGAANSMQFSAMNSVTLKDLPATYSGAGSSLYSMAQMLAMSFAVAAAGTALSLFRSAYASLSAAFSATFIFMAGLGVLSMGLFWQLPKDNIQATPATD